MAAASRGDPGQAFAAAQARGGDRGLPAPVMGDSKVRAAVWRSSSVLRGALPGVIRVCQLSHYADSPRCLRSTESSFSAPGVPLTGGGVTRCALLSWQREPGNLF